MMGGGVCVMAKGTGLGGLIVNAEWKYWLQPWLMMYFLGLRPRG